MQGFDEVWIEDATSLEDLKECAEAIGGRWPDAVFEDVAAGEFAFDLDSLLPSDGEELCVYQSLDAARAWQSGDAKKCERNTMIQLRQTPRGFSLIADDWNVGELPQILSELRARFVSA